jgi:hypothetical protein
VQQRKKKKPKFRNCNFAGVKYGWRIFCFGIGKFSCFKSLLITPHLPSHPYLPHPRPPFLNAQERGEKKKPLGPASVFP